MTNHENCKWYCRSSGKLNWNKKEKEFEICPISLKHYWNKDYIPYYHETYQDEDYQWYDDEEEYERLKLKKGHKSSAYSEREKGGSTLLEYSLLKKSNNICNISRLNIDPKSIEWFIMKKLYKFQDIPKCPEYDEIRILEIKSNPWRLILINNPTQELIFIALKINGLVLKVIENQNDEMCKVACKQNEKAIKYVKTLNTLPLQLLACRLFPIRVLEIDDPNEEVVLMAVKNDGSMLKYITNPNRKIIISAMKNNGMILQHVEAQDEGICLAAVKQNGMAIEFAKFKTDKVKFAAVRNNSYSLKHITDQSQDLCILACSKQGFALKYVIDRKNYDICKIACENRPGAIRYMDIQYNSICEMACSVYGYLIRDVKIHTDKIIEIACNNNPKAIWFVENPTLKLCKQVLKVDELAITLMENRLPELVILRPDIYLDISERFMIEHYKFIIKYSKSKKNKQLAKNIFITKRQGVIDCNFTTYSDLLIVH